jgi:hypothetical protein
VTYPIVDGPEGVGTDQAVINPHLHNSYIDVKGHFGGTINGVANDRTVIQNAIDAANAAGGAYVLLRPGVWGIGSALVAKSGVKLLLSPGAELKLLSGSNSWMLTHTSGDLSDFSLIGGTLNANAALQSTAGGGIYFGGPVGVTVNHLLIEDVRVENASTHGIALEGVGDTETSKIIRGCTVDGHGINAVGFGIYVDYAKGAKIVENTVGGGLNDSDAIELGHTGRYYCAGNHVLQNQINFPFADDSVIESNWLYGSNGTIQNDANTAHRVQICGNHIIGATPAANFGGIAVTGDDAIVEGNHVSVTAQKGIRIVGAGGIVEGNRIKTTAGTVSGYGVSTGEGEANDTIVRNNRISGLFVAGVAIDSDGTSVSGNRITGAMTNGVLLHNTGTLGYSLQNVSVDNNTILGPITPINFENQTALSNTASGNKTDGSTDVASAATVTLGWHSDYFNVTGTTTITSVAASWAGRVVTLKFAGILTFTDGSNLKINGDFVTSADDTLTLVCDGTNWYEVTRSAN